jgi:arylsulfatase A-like enzyme
MDWGIGEVMKTLAELKLDENTLVIFASDNGPLFRPHEELARVYGEAGRLLPQTHVLREGKYTTAEGGVRVPMIARWTGRIPAGTESAEIAAGFDWLPTFARLAGGDAPKDRIIDGKDILPLLTDDNAKSPHDTFFYFANYALEGVRKGKWKLRLVDHAPLKDGEAKRPGVSLYDLEKDVGETTNVAADHPDVVAELQKLLDACRADLGDGAKNPGPGRRPPGKVGNGPPRAG